MSRSATMSRASQHDDPLKRRVLLRLWVSGVLLYRAPGGGAAPPTRSPAPGHFKFGWKCAPEAPSLIAACTVFAKEVNFKCPELLWATSAGPARYPWHRLPRQDPYAEHPCNPSRRMGPSRGRQKEGSSRGGGRDETCSWRPLLPANISTIQDHTPSEGAPSRRDLDFRSLHDTLCKLRLVAQSCARRLLRITHAAPWRIFIMVWIISKARPRRTCVARRGGLVPDHIVCRWKGSSRGPPNEGSSREDDPFSDLFGDPLRLES